MNEREVSIREICSLVNRLNNKVVDLQNSLDMLEAEVLAIGNLLVKKQTITLKELDNYTALIVKQKMAEKQVHRAPDGSLKDIREEFEEAVQNRIRQ